MGMFNDAWKFPENTSFSKYIKNDIFLLNKTQATTYSILVGSMTVLMEKLSLILTGINMIQSCATLKDFTSGEFPLA